MLFELELMKLGYMNSHRLLQSSKFLLHGRLVCSYSFISRGAMHHMRSYLLSYLQLAEAKFLPCVRLAIRFGNV
jgi:hypothetical protein